MMDRNIMAFASEEMSQSHFIHPFEFKHSLLFDIRDLCLVLVGDTLRRPPKIILDYLEGFEHQPSQYQ